MAPEVGIGQPYNELCDVYSFGVLVWEMMALRKPYGTMDLAGMVQDVWNDGPNGKRPSPSLVQKGRFLTVRGMNSRWRRFHFNDRDTITAGSPAAALQSIVVSCWSCPLDERPSMTTVEKQLQKVLLRFFGNRYERAKARRYLTLGSTVFSEQDDDQKEEKLIIL